MLPAWRLKKMRSGPSVGGLWLGVWGAICYKQKACEYFLTVSKNENAFGFSLIVPKLHLWTRTGHSSRLTAFGSRTSWEYDFSSYREKKKNQMPLDRDYIQEQKGRLLAAGPQWRALAKTKGIFPSAAERSPSVILPRRGAGEILHEHEGSCQSSLETLPRRSRPRVLLLSLHFCIFRFYSSRALGREGCLWLTAHTRGLPSKLSEMGSVVSPWNSMDCLSSETHTTKDGLLAPRLMGGGS